MQCSACAKSVVAKPTANGERLPKGWKRTSGVYCPKCWSTRYVLRAITIPVVRPLGDGVGWPELREALTESWSHTTAAINWLTTELFAADTKREPGQERLAKMPRSYLYPEMRKRFPELPSQVCAALENSIKSRYSKKRFETLWTCEASLPNARYPQPAIAPNQSWTASYQSAGKNGGDLVPCVSVTLLGGKRFLLQLQGGNEWRRQLGAFKQIESGEAIQGELAIIRKRVGDDSRSGMSARDTGGQKIKTRVMVKLVAWFPRKTPSEAKDTLFVRTDSESFAVALDQHGNKLRIWNADHVRRWVSEHRRRIQRLSDDQKAEQRPLAAFQSRRESHVHKQQNRLESFIKEFVAQVCGVAKRMNFAAIQWDDSYRSYVERFPWFQLRTQFTNKCNEHGITLEFASADVASKTVEPLAETEV